MNLGKKDFENIIDKEGNTGDNQFLFLVEPSFSAQDINVTSHGCMCVHTCVCVSFGILSILSLQRQLPSFELS